MGGFVIFISYVEALRSTAVDTSLHRFVGSVVQNRGR